MSDDNSPMSESVNLADISSKIGDTSLCDMYVNTDQSDTSVMTTPKVKSKRRYLMSPVLQKGYYGRKRIRRLHWSGNPPDSHRLRPLVSDKYLCVTYLLLLACLCGHQTTHGSKHFIVEWEQN